jgi:hypothetical protein
VTLTTELSLDPFLQDIGNAYEKINELHRIAEELLHAGPPGHPLDQEVQAYMDAHHGWVDEVSPRVVCRSQLLMHHVRMQHQVIWCAPLAAIDIRPGRTADVGVGCRGSA